MTCDPRLTLNGAIHLTKQNGETIVGRLINLGSDGALLSLEHGNASVREGETIRLTIEWTQPEVAWAEDETFEGVVQEVVDGNHRVTIAFTHSTAA
jgi:hypothetical protein